MMQSVITMLINEQHMQNRNCYTKSCNFQARICYQ
jgi:hypothetical protein